MDEKMEEIDAFYNDWSKPELELRIYGLETRVKELEEGIEKVLLWRNFDGDGISDPLRQELYKLIKGED